MKLLNTLQFLNYYWCYIPRPEHEYQCGLSIFNEKNIIFFLKNNKFSLFLGTGDFKSFFKERCIRKSEFENTPSFTIHANVYVVAILLINETPSHISKSRNTHLAPSPTTVT